MKHHITLLLTTLFLIPILIGCKEKTIIEKENEPTNNTEIVDVSAERVTFFIESDNATEYAYILGESTLENITAEALFLKATEEGSTGEFNLEQPSDKVKIEITLKVRRNKEYKLYTAVKKEKYSDVALVEFNTSFDYTEPITVENIEPRSFTYHIKREQGWNSYKHCVVRKVDYIAVRNMLAGLVDVTPASYNESFGHLSSEDITVDLDKCFKDGDSEAQEWGIYPDACYMIIASPVDEEGRVIGGISIVKEFNTAKAPESEGKIAIEITAVSSVSASIRFTPDAQITEYYYTVLTKKDYKQILDEGLESVKAAAYMTYENPESSQVTYDLTDLVPNTEYVIMAGGFDDNEAEFFDHSHTFKTEAPSGPVSEITIEKTGITANAADFNVKVTNCSDLRIVCATKKAVDDVLVYHSLETAIYQNGIFCEEQDLNKALSAQGLDVHYDNLEANTKYVFGVAATNPEKVLTIDTVEFVTEPLPLAGEEYREKLPGEWICEYIDQNDNHYSFKVTIAEGVSEATTRDYMNDNRLVILGFDPCGVDYHSPEDLIEKGYASTMEEAEANYGPKWFLKFRQDGSITTPYSHPNEYDYALNWNMLNFDGKQYWMPGIAMASKGESTVCKGFDVEVSDDFNTITIKPFYHKFVYEDSYRAYYPGVMSSENCYYPTDKVLLYTTDNVILKRSQL